MTMCIPEDLRALVEQGEGLTVEFKRSRTDITKDVYETVCAFSNREGGHIFLGVADDGTITGIQEDRIERMKRDFVTTINNVKKMYPPLYLQPIEYEVDGAYILYIYVPNNPSVCRCGGRIFDRNNESDIDITNNEYLVYQLYARKQDTYYVNKVFPVFSISDLRHDLLDRARDMTRMRMQNHPWRDMTDEQLLRSAKLILHDSQTGQEGITLAAILLFGPDDLIISVLAHHKTDAILRVYNVDRYDDRDVIITNLLDSYDRLISFGERHLNDLFTMDGMVSVSSRNMILREIVSNLLVHRDFSSGYVAKLVIERSQIYTENANRSHGYGSLNLNTFKPFPKNPPISNAFREIGLVDELGSGMRNTYKYTQLYSGAEPQFIEGDVFRTVIPLSEAAMVKVGSSVGTGQDASQDEATDQNTDQDSRQDKHTSKDSGQDKAQSYEQDNDTGQDTTQSGEQDNDSGQDTTQSGEQDNDTGQDTTQSGEQDTGQGARQNIDRNGGHNHNISSEERVEILLDYCCEPRSRTEMQEYLRLSSRRYFIEKILEPLLKNGQLRMTIPEKPTSRNQKYIRN